MANPLSLNSNYDDLVVSIHQIDALLDMVTSTDLTELKPETLSNYFWVARDILDKAKTSCSNLSESSIIEITQEVRKDAD